MEEDGIGEDTVERPAWQIKIEEVLMPDLGTRALVRHAHEGLAAVEACYLVTE